MVVCLRVRLCFYCFSAGSLKCWLVVARSATKTHLRRSKPCTIIGVGDSGWKARPRFKKLNRSAFNGFINFARNSEVLQVLLHHLSGGGGSGGSRFVLQGMKVWKKRMQTKKGGDKGRSNPPSLNCPQVSHWAPCLPLLVSPLWQQLMPSIFV